MGHHHSHHCHHHNHDHLTQDKLKKAMFLSFLIFIVEIIGGIYSNSLALFSDAGHLLSDILSLFIAWLATKFATKSPNEKFSFGYHRVTVLAALFNGLSLIGIVVFMTSEAFERLFHPETVEGFSLMIVAIIGLIINVYIGMTLIKFQDNVNIKGALLHVLGDALSSVGVIISGIIIIFTDWYFVDPIISFIIAIIIAFGGIRIIKDTVYILMEGTPQHLSIEEVKILCMSHDIVETVENIHLWSLTTDKHILSLHLGITEDVRISELEEVISTITQQLKTHLHIYQVNISYSLLKK